MDVGKTPSLNRSLEVVVRIKAGDPINPSVAHFGTGFYYQFCADEKVTFPVIVSNRHVLENKTWLEFEIALNDGKGARRIEPAYVVRKAPGALQVIGHPDPTVDLACVSVVEIMAGVEADTGLLAHVTALDKGNFPPADLLLPVGTEVVMVGYPNGLVDEKNNLPVLRRGTLASPYEVNWEGNTDFVADIAVYKGSSGSPVFAFFPIALPRRDTLDIIMEPKTFFIGVLHSGPVLDARGEIVLEPAPTMTPAVVTQLMLNLGCCCRAERIEEFLPIIRAWNDIAAGKQQLNS